MFKYLIVALLMVVGQMTLAQEKRFEDLTAPQFSEKLGALPDAVLVDVRTPEELKDGMIPNAKNIDFKGDDFENQLKNLDRNTTYFVYCAAGARSGKTADMMKELGFLRVYNLESGYKGWVEAGLPTVSPQ